MNFVVFIGIAQAIFLSLLLWVKKERKIFDFILIAWLMINAIYLYFFYLNFTGQTTEYVPFLLVSSILAYLTAPLLYLYVCALIKPDQFRLVSYGYHFIPYLFFIISMLYFYYNLQHDRSIWVEEGYVHLSGNFPFHMRYHALIMAFFSFLYPMLSLYLLFRHQHRIQKEFSSLDKVNLNWLKNWIIIMIVGFWLTFGIIWAGIFEWIGFMVSFKVTAMAIVASIFIIGFYGLKQTTIFTTSPESGFITPNAQNRLKKYSGSSLNEGESEKIWNDLTVLMDQQKAYLKNDLNLEDLAQQLDVKKHKLSQVINERSGTNFFYFVNRYRVEEFKELLDQDRNQRFSLLGIAMESGFNSKSSFNEVFKKIEGITPSEYKKNIRK